MAKRIRDVIGFLRLGTPLLLALIGAGCCSVVSNSGDAKILRCRHWMYSPGSKSFDMVLPAVGLAEVGTHVIQVRNVPAYLTGLFDYQLSMDVSDEEADEDRNAPWHDARISVVFRKLNGTEAFRQSFHLGETAHAFGQRHHGWQALWGLGAGSHMMDPVPVKDESFDIIVTVEQPSRRPTDKITLSAFAVWYPKP